MTLNERQKREGAQKLLDKLGYVWDRENREWVKDYSGIGVIIPPEHRATPRGNQ